MTTNNPKAVIVIFGATGDLANRQPFTDFIVMESYPILLPSSV